MFNIFYNLFVASMSAAKPGFCGFRRSARGI